MGKLMLEGEERKQLFRVIVVYFYEFNFVVKGSLNQCLYLIKIFEDIGISFLNVMRKYIFQSVVKVIKKINQISIYKVL